ncbi:hypothetical protein [Corynebacterium halotolerans]|uniref:hypothetical protein n=1 Tax=Corynebacterium halotolerans TaxID=225326 RepID=UPI003CF5E4D8
MDTNGDFDLDRYLLELEENDSVPDWVDIQDLNRISVEQHQINLGATGVISKPNGTIRLTGEGVDQHSLSLNAAGDVLNGFQNLVTAIGASLRGVQSERGKLPASISEHTKLMLDASPAPGSVVLKFSPNYRPAEDTKQLELELAEEEEPLVEQSIIDLINALSSPADSQEDFLDNAGSIDRSGPRVVSATKGFMETLSDNGLDLDLKWRVPRMGTRKLLFRAAQAKAFFDALDKVDTDSGVISVSAVVEGVSRFPNPHVILKIVSIDDGKEISEGELRPFVRESVPDVVHVSIEEDDNRFQRLRIDDEVEASLAVDATRFPGKSWKLAFALNYWE